MVRAGKARRSGSYAADRESDARVNVEEHALSVQNDSQIGSLQFSDQQGFIPQKQAGMRDTLAVALRGSQMSGQLGFRQRLNKLDVGTGNLDLDRDAQAVPLLYPQPSAHAIAVLSAGTTSDLITMTLPAYEGARVTVYNILGNTITIKHTAGAVIHSIITPTGGDVTLSGSNAVEFVYSIIINKWILLTAGGGGACPVICVENDLGDITGAVDLDWSIANFHRGVLTGDVTFNIINTPADTLWQDICLEVQQDEVGDHKVDFVQGFANSFIPVVISGAGRYTSFQIYTYEEPGGNDIFQGFNKNGNNGPQVPGGGGLFQGFAGYIQAVLSSDQTSNLGLMDHIEFDTVVDSDTLGVTSGAGQLAGIFRNFRPGHTYECEVYISGEGSGNTLNWAAKWFDIGGNTFIGTEAEQIATTGATNRGSQFVGKAFFRSISLGDSLKVRITNNTVLTSILNGSASTEPTTFATIKDCGVVEEVINQPEPAPEDGELDIREMMYARVTTPSSATRFDTRLQIRLDFGDVAPSVGLAPLIRNIRMKGLMVNVTTKGAGDRLFNLTADGVDIGPVHTLPANTTGFIDFGAFDVLMEKGKNIGWKTSGGSSGDDWQMTMIVWFL